MDPYIAVIRRKRVWYVFATTSKHQDEIIGQIDEDCYTGFSTADYQTAMKEASAIAEPSNLRIDILYPSETIKYKSRKNY